MILFKKKDINLDNWRNLEECLNKQINITIQKRPTERISQLPLL